MTDESPYEKGLRGEKRALEYLIQRGMTPLATRYHSPFGEIDLILLDGEALALVEVKARERGASEAMNAVTPRKIRRVVETARCYLGEHPEHAHRAVRFDLALVARNGVTYIQNAFEGREW